MKQNIFIKMPQAGYLHAFKVVFLPVLMCFFVGCSLDETPQDQIPEEDAFKTPELLFRNTVSTLYNYIGGHEDGQGLQGTCRGVYDLQTFGSDEALLPTRGGDWYDGGIWQAMYKHSWTAGHELVKNSWLYLYKVITLCNRSLEMLEKYKKVLNSEIKEKEYKAEVRALRAMYYWYLIDLFGNVPIITSTDVSMQDVSTSPRAEVFDFVVKELEDVLDDVNYANSVAAGEFYGRVTCPVVFFVLAKLMLNAEVYSGTPQWQKTIDYCTQLERWGFSLENFYIDNFAIRNENSLENIFVIPMDRDLYTNQQHNMIRSWHYRHAAACGFSGENGTCATRKVLEVNHYGLEDMDNRFTYNYWFDGVTDYADNPVLDRNGLPLKYHPEAVKYILSGDKYVETAGARMKKYEVDKNAIAGGKLMDNDIVLFRYSDVLLMRAEAKMRLGEGGQEDFDAVRERAFMGKRELTPQNLLDERLIELCWEGWRRQDLIRFGQYESLYQGPDKVDESDGHTTLYPIPADVVTLNPNLKQNPGY